MTETAIPSYLEIIDFLASGAAGISATLGLRHYPEITRRTSFSSTNKCRGSVGEGMKSNRS